MKMTRREFMIKGTSLFATIGLGVPLLLGKDGHAIQSEEARAEGTTSLVVVQLSGGNDGINTLIPYGLGGYYDARPMLRLGESEVLALNGSIGLHPSLTGLFKYYEEGKLAIVQGVGYPNPDRSHFRSMDIWQTAEPDKLSYSGWLGRYVQSSLKKVSNPLKAVQVGSFANVAFNEEDVNVPVIQTLDSFRLLDPKTPRADQNRLTQAFLEMYDPQRQGSHLQVTCRKGADAYDSVEAIQSLAATYQTKVEYPKTGIGRDLQLAAKMLAGRSGTRVFYVQLGGFDDHAQEKDQHARLLKDLDQALEAFQLDLQVQGLEENVATVVFSEFGRRVKENGSGGTDHGTAAPMFVLGGKIRGGLYGAYPSLTNLDAVGDLKYEVDFRSVYSTLVDGWLRGDARSVVGDAYESLPILVG